MSGEVLLVSGPVMAALVMVVGYSAVVCRRRARHVREWDDSLGRLRRAIDTDT